MIIYTEYVITIEYCCIMYYTMLEVQIYKKNTAVFLAASVASVQGLYQSYWSTLFIQKA